jgi:metal-dependent amidase/aminoacylase/carboxypeptidase family protein
VAVAAAADVVGAGNVDPEAALVLGAEDFSSMLEARPGAFVFMGQGAGGATSAGLHTPNYDFNDEAIPYGVGYWVKLVGKELGSVGVG